jgi:hypothetical protein
VNRAQYIRRKTDDLGNREIVDFCFPGLQPREEDDWKTSEKEL